MDGFTGAIPSLITMVKCFFILTSSFGRTVRATETASPVLCGAKACTPYVVVVVDSKIMEHSSRRSDFGAANQLQLELTGKEVKGEEANSMAVS